MCIEEPQYMLKSHTSVKKGISLYKSRLSTAHVIIVRHTHTAMRTMSANYNTGNDNNKRQRCPHSLLCRRRARP
jgi:hypothetical protein